MPEKFEDYLFPIVRERKDKFITHYAFKIRGGKGYRGGYVRPSLKELPHLELTDFLNYGSLEITSEFAELWVKGIMLVFIKPFEVIKFINRIREIFSKAGSKFKPRVVRENFDIKLPEITFYAGTVSPTFEYNRSKKVIICNYDLPVSEDFIIWLFKEVEEEFVSFVEAYEEETRRQKILQEQKTEQKQEKTQS